MWPRPPPSSFRPQVPGYLKHGKIGSSLIVNAANRRVGLVAGHMTRIGEGQLEPESARMIPCAPYSVMVVRAVVVRARSLMASGRALGRRRAAGARVALLRAIGTWVGARGLPTLGTTGRTLGASATLRSEISPGAWVTTGSWAPLKTRVTLWARARLRVRSSVGMGAPHKTWASMRSWTWPMVMVSAPLPTFRRTMLSPIAGPVDLHIPVVPHEIDRQAAGFIELAMSGPVPFLSWANTQVDWRWERNPRGRWQHDDWPRIDHWRCRIGGNVQGTIEIRFPYADRDTDIRGRLQGKNGGSRCKKSWSEEPKGHLECVKLKTLPRPVHARVGS